MFSTFIFYLLLTHKRFDFLDFVFFKTFFYVIWCVIWSVIQSGLIQFDPVRSRFCRHHLKYISLPLKHNTLLVVYYTFLNNSYSESHNHHWHKVHVVHDLFMLIRSCLYNINIMSHTCTTEFKLAEQEFFYNRSPSTQSHGKVN